MLINMRFTDTTTKQTFDVVVYHIFNEVETLECFGVCWVPSKSIWMTVPMYMLTPKSENKKEILTEG